MLKNLLKPWMLLATLCCFFASPLLFAAQVSNLDEALVSVASRSLEDKNVGLREALAKVFVKNSGTESVLSHEMVIAQLQNPNALLSQFGHVEQDGQLQLKASFDHNRVVSILREAYLPVWGSQRPLTLMWFAFENDSERLILNDSSALNIRRDFQAQSTNRGLPMIFPVMDLDELTQVNVADVRGMFVDNVALASERYQADFFAVSSVEVFAGSYQYQISLFPRKGNEPMIQPLFSTQGNSQSLVDVAQDIVAALSEFYVTKYAIANSGSQFLSTVTFVQNTNIQQLVDIENYLKGLSAVKSVFLSSIAGDKAVFSLSLFGSEADFERLLTLEPRISLVTPSQDQVNSVIVVPPQTEPTSLSDSLYQWQGR